MKRLIFFVFVLLLCCCEKEEQRRIHIRMNSLDVKMWKAPDGEVFPYDVILDSLENIRKLYLSNEEKMYNLLLTTIAKYEASTPIASDSTIATVVKWYKKIGLPFNEARALYYHALIDDRINENDSSVFIMLKEAEKVVNEYNIQDNKLKGLVANALGKELYQSRDFDASIEQFTKAIDNFQAINDFKNYNSAKINIAWNYFSARRENEALKVLESIDPVQLPISLLSEYYSIYASIYSWNSDYKKTIHYTQLRRNLSHSDTSLSILARRNNELCRFFFRLEQLDSAIFYGEAAVEIEEKSDMDKRDHLLLLSNVYFSAHRYEQAYTSLIKAYRVENISNRKTTNKKILEIESKYNFAESERLREIERTRSRIITISLTFLLLISSLTIYIILSRRKMKDDKIRQLKMAFDIQKRNLNLLPKMIKDIDNCASRYAKNAEIFDDICEISKKYREKSRENNYYSAKEIKSIDIKKGKMEKEHPNLSDKEVIVFYLVEQGFSYSEISQIMGLSPENVRAINAKITKKFAKTNPPQTYSPQ